MITETLNNLLHQTAFFNLDWGNYVMIAVACFFLYLAIKHEFEPLLLVPIAFGMLLVNIYPDIMAEPYTDVQGLEHAGGLFYYFFTLDEWSILPSLIFMGVGAMTDFGPLIANPISFFMGAAAQLGIYLAYFLRYFHGIQRKRGSSYLHHRRCRRPDFYLPCWISSDRQHLMGPIAVAAYSYMSLVPIIQPPVMKLLTTEKERKIKMEQLRPVSKLEKILFPIIVITIVVCMILPSTAPLVGMLMLGNLFRECGVVKQLPGDSFQCHDVHRSYPSWYFRRCIHQCRGILKCQHLKDRCPGSDRIRIRYRRRCPVRKATVQGNPRKDQPADRFCRCICGTYGSPCIPESRCGGRSDQLPADACNGTERSRCYRYSRSGRYLHGDLRCITS